MREVTEAAGLSALNLPDNWEDGTANMLSMQMAVEDFDHDGFLDVVLANGNGQQILLRSENGQRFRTAAKFPARHRTQYGIDFSTAAFDYDGDSYSDILVGRRLYRNLQGRKFRDVTDTTGLQFSDAVSMGYSIVDYDLDGHQDIYCNYSVAIHRRSSAQAGWIGDHSGAHNQLFRNRGDGTFEEVATDTNLTGGPHQTFASIWFHANDDMYPDLYLANDFAQNVLLLNRGEHGFEDNSKDSRTADFATSMGAAAGDFNNDGAAELYVANMYSKMGRRIVAHVGREDYPPGIIDHIRGACAGNRFYQREPGSEDYRETSMQLGINDIGWAYGPATFDYDNDGNLDLYATTGFLSFDRGKPDG